jgi:TusA-related sulfurtransferase
VIGLFLTKENLMKIKAIHVFLAVGISFLTSCQETHYNYLCTGLGDSSPTDLLIVNNTTQIVNLTLSVKEESLKKIKKMKLQPGEEVEVCIENEGYVTDGLYFIYNGQHTMVQLKSQEINVFSLKEGMLEN